MSRRLHLVAQLVLLCVTVRVMHAQPAAPRTADAMLLARADSLHVGEYCTLTKAVIGSPAIMGALASDTTAVKLSASTICDPLFAAFSLRALYGDSHAPLAAVARLHTSGNTANRLEIFDAMQEFRAAVLEDTVRAVTRDALPQETRTALTRMLTTTQGLTTVAARDRALDRLAKYERKLGPTSAKLNGVEVLLNYAAQRWLPGFRADPLQGPSAWEVVASYVPAYVTRANNRVQPVSATEFGLRRYLFGKQFGATGIRGIVFPSYWSAGMLTASDHNGALVTPWEDHARYGGYLSWGATKVGYIRGRNGAWLVSKQFQAIPFLF